MLHCENDSQLFITKAVFSINHKLLPFPWTLKGE